MPYRFSRYFSNKKAHWQMSVGFFVAEVAMFIVFGSTFKVGYCRCFSRQ